MNFSSPFRQLPEGASYLPAYLHKFVELLAKSAHNFVHVNDDQLFNLAKFWSGMRLCLYNTGRNEKKRGAPGPATGAETEAAESPAAVDDEVQDPASQKPESDEGMEDGPQEPDEFFNFRRSRKDKKGAAVDKSGQDTNGSEPDTEVLHTPNKTPASDVKDGKRKAEGSLADATPGKMQRQSTLKTNKAKESIYDQLVSAAALGQTVDEIVELLRARHALWKDSRSRHNKKHCEKIAELIVDICNANPKDSWKSVIESYKPSLSKMHDFY